MANADKPNGFRLVKDIGGELRIWKGTLAASQTVAVGDALVKDRITGYLSIATSTSQEIEGFANEAVTTGSGATDDIEYIPALPWNEFEGQCSGTFAATMIGETCDIEGTTGIMEINENSKLYNVIRITGYNSNSAVGANTRVRFRVNKSSCYPTHRMELLSNQTFEEVADNKTLDAGDVGVWQVVTVDAKTITLPAVAAGAVYKIMNGAAPGAALVTVAPNASDLFLGQGLSATDADTYNNTKATAKTGDYIIVMGGNATGWNIIDQVGTWALIAV